MSWDFSPLFLVQNTSYCYCLCKHTKCFIFPKGTFAVSKGSLRLQVCHQCLCSHCHVRKVNDYVGMVSMPGQRPCVDTVSEYSQRLCQQGVSVVNTYMLIHFIGIVNNNNNYTVPSDVTIFYMIWYNKNVLLSTVFSRKNSSSSHAQRFTSGMYSKLNTCELVK